MLALISPAKKLEGEDGAPVDEFTQPLFSKESQKLVDSLKKMGPTKIQNLMKLSESLATLNTARYKAYKKPFTLANARQAVFAFRGDTYVGLDADTLSKEDLAFAQGHLRILSGLYGLLRPLDLMQPYRLEMGTKLRGDYGANLYAFWGDQLAKTCDKAVKDHKDPTLVCLASNEYIKAVPLKATKSPLITCHFKEMKDGTPKTIGFFAKKARGMMARHMIQNRIETPDGLKDFKTEGYKFQPKLSSDTDFVFVRREK